MERIYGLYAALAVLQTKPEMVQVVYCQEGRQDQRLQAIRTLVETQQIPLNIVARSKLDRFFQEKVTHQGVVLELKSLPQYTESDLKRIVDQSSEGVLLLILDGVQDPHNLGACLRSANVMGVQAVIAPKDRAVGITPVVRKVACGAAEMTPFISVSNLSRTLKALKEQGIWLVGMVGDASTSLSSVDLTGSIALVVGGEGKGLRRLTREHCDYLASVPMSGAVDSLNVSVAVGVGLYEVVRQRLA